MADAQDTSHQTVGINAKCRERRHPVVLDFERFLPRYAAPNFKRSLCC
jgi:hypothetical protein